MERRARARQGLRRTRARSSESLLTDAGPRYGRGMNRFDPNFASARLARLRYRDADYDIQQEGDYVLCAVTGQAIPVIQLRYWNVARQEAYASAEISFRRHLEMAEA